MKDMKWLTLTMTLASLAASGVALADSRSSVVGTWNVVSNDIESNGKTTPNFGANPKGALILTDDGHFISMSIRQDLPKFASGRRTTGTADENKAVVQGSIALYGTYNLDGSTLIFHVEKSTFPNWDGQDQHRPFKLSGNTLEYTVAASGGPGTSHVVFERASSSQPAGR